MAIIKLLSKTNLEKLARKNAELNRALEKHELKFAKTNECPLDYILIVP